MAYSSFLNLRDIWKRRSLILAFAITDLKLRYRNSFLGFLWSLVEPLLILSVLYLVFTNIFKTEIENYVLFLLLGIVIWFFFNRATSMSLNCLLNRKNIITKIYFPREILVISSCLTAFFMATLEFAVFFLFMIPVQFIPPLTFLWLFLIIILEFIFILGISFLLAILNTRLRDIQNIWTVVLQAGFFVMPIIYKLEIFPQAIQEILYYVPLVHVLEISRDVVVNGNHPQFENLGYLILSSLAILVVGYIVFHKFESRIVEEL